MSNIREQLMAKKLAPQSAQQIPGPGVTLQTSEPEQQKKEKSFHVFFHTSPSCRMVTETGRVIAFVDYRYVTDIAEDIAYLQKEVTLGHPNLYIKDGYEVMTSSQLDPMKMLKAKIIAEYEAEQKAKAAAIASGNLQNFGTSEQQKLTPGSTSDVGVVAAGSASPAAI